MYSFLKDLAFVFLYIDLQFDAKQLNCGIKYSIAWNKESTVLNYLYLTPFMYFESQVWKAV